MARSKTRSLSSRRARARGERGVTWTLPALYVLSGAAALILEVTWSRLFTLQFGHTTGATSTVLAAFMGGLAAGAAIGGRLADAGDGGGDRESAARARPRALRLYAILEVVVAVSAVILPIVLTVADPLLAWAYADGAGGWRFGVVRVVISLIVLAAPTMAMGATYPLAMRALAAEGTQSSLAAGLLYTANTIGAASGAFAAGYLLLPSVGIRMTTFAAAALNLTAAAIAWRLATREAANPSDRARRGAAATSAAVTAPDPVNATNAMESTAVGGSQAAARGAAHPKVPARGAHASVGLTQAEASEARRRRVFRSAARGVPAWPADRGGGLWIGLMAAAAFGLVGLANQVVWTRVIALIVGPTTYAFSAMVGVFIAGLAVGAAGGTKLARGPRAALWLGVMGLIVAAAIVLSMHFTGRLLLWMAVASIAEGPSFGLTLWRQLGVAAALLGPLSIASGAAFPLAVAVASSASASAPASRRGEGSTLTPRRLAAVYAANTAGAIAGALIAGFVCVPAFGLQTTLRIAAGISVVIGTVMLLAASRRSIANGERAPISWTRVAAALASGAVVATGVFARGSWDPALLSSGAYRFAPAVAAADAGAAAGAGRNADSGNLEAMLTAGDLLFYDEGASATVAVRQLGGTTSLVIDGKPDASNDADMLTQKLLAHLPLLHHDQPRRALVLGLGSGVTAGAALTHPLTALDIVEISPGVVTASNYFRSENRQALADPRTRLLVADGRSHLRLASSSYDVVISEPSNPWMAGVASLFTREFMTSVRERLNPGGVFCQWTHTYDMSRDDLRSIVATFTSVFPNASLWLVGESDVLLIGSVPPPSSLSSAPTPSPSSLPSPSPFTADLATLERRYANPTVRDDLHTVAVSGIGDLAGLRVADAAALRRYTMDAPIQTDDRMTLEFSAPRSLVDRAGAQNAAELLSLAAAPPVETTSEPGRAWASRGRMMLRAEAFDLAYDALAKAIALRVDDEETTTAFAQAAAGAGKVDAAIALLRGQGDRSDRTIPMDVTIARLLMARGDAEGALAALAPALDAPSTQSAAFTTTSASAKPNEPQSQPQSQSEPQAQAAPQAQMRDPRVLRELASIYADVGDSDRLAPVVALLRERLPVSADTQYYAAALAFMQGDLDAALAQARSLVAAHPTDARAHNLIGAALATRGQTDDARAAFARAIAADPRDAAAYVNAGSLDLEQGRAADARRHFAVAMTLDASNESARQGLATARSRLAQR